MAFYTTIGYAFDIPTTVKPQGSIILSSVMPMHQLLRRKMKKLPFLNRRLFDPQLYLAGLEATSSPKPCVKLASYPWFGCTAIDIYNSKEQSQATWSADALSNIATTWPGCAPTDTDVIKNAIADCIDFQTKIGCEAIILPSPLTVDPAAGYQEELLWLDLAQEYLSTTLPSILPIYATVAINDNCLRHLDAKNNPMLDMIADSVSARGVDGVYLVVEQGGESSDSRQCNSAKVLESLLHLVHVFSQDCGLAVVVNFVGAFGLACEAAGAQAWGSQWYKSLYRLRIQDKQAEGRAYPTYWTRKAAIDINLEKDFDSLNQLGLMSKLADKTGASAGLTSIIGTSTKTEDVPAWRYSQSNVKAIREHYCLSVIDAENELALRATLKEKCDYIQAWLDNASKEIINIQNKLKQNSTKLQKTQTGHVSAWAQAFKNYRIAHNA